MDGSGGDASEAGVVVEAGVDASGAGEAGPDAGSGCIRSLFGDYVITTAGHVFASHGNSTSTSWTPVTVAGGGDLDRVVAGVQSPSFGAALRDDGTVWCWSNTSSAAAGNVKTSGDMGDGTLTWPAQAYVATQVQVQPTGSGPTYLTGIASLTNSGENAYARPFCAVDSGGHVWCWGPTHPSGGGGTLLINTAGASYSAPYAIMIAKSAAADVLTGVSQVSAGSNQICVILTSGQVECWGTNAYGELGTATADGGSTSDSDYPVPVPGLPASPAPTEIMVGNGTTCVLVGGQVYCWGQAANGATGTGVPPGRNCLGIGQYCEPAGNPVVMALADGGVGSALTGVKDMYFGYFFGCAITNSGALLCWGAGPSGIVLAEPFPLAAGGSPTNVTHVTSTTTGDFSGIRFSESDDTFYVGTSNHSVIACQ
jgi:hypothetical protein